VRTVLVIGIGSGAPERLTLEAVAAIGRADVFFSMEKGGAADELDGLRRSLCERFATARPHRFVAVPDPPRDRAAADYHAGVADWTAARARLWERLLREELDDGGCGAFLAWGDPAFYDSILRVLEQLSGPGGTARGGGLELHVEVVPGVSSIQALAAAHRISLTRVGTAVHLTTGRHLTEDGVPAGADDVVVMLDGGTAFTALDPDGWHIFWGAYLGMPGQILDAGPLVEAGPRIVAARTAARARRGWIMDTYLLRRIPSAAPDRT
jgi:precorrin-6A synthase